MESKNFAQVLSLITNTFKLGCFEKIEVTIVYTQKCGHLKKGNDLKDQARKQVRSSNDNELSQSAWYFECHPTWDLYCCLQKFI